jgi:protein-S-isoprenylcysteine O-methyltransferase Ste14
MSEEDGWRLTSAALVTLQLGLIFVLVVATHWPVLHRAWPVTLFLLSMAIVLGVWTLGFNRWGNFNIRPELRSGARLVTSGPYRWIRHPMYASVLLAVAGVVYADPRLWRVVLLVALLIVLVLKAAREEDYLRAAFPEYAAYASRTWRLIPFVF